MIKIFKIIFSIITITAVTVVCLLWLRENNLFVLNRVKVVGNIFITKEEIIELADLDFSKEVFYLDKEMIRRNVLDHPLIKDVVVTRYLPSAVKIKVTEFDIIASSINSKKNILDSEGTIISTDRFDITYDFPVITGTSIAIDSLGFEEVPSTMKEMIKILKAVRAINFQLYHEISEIHFNKKVGIIIYLRNKVLPVIFGYRDYSRKVNYFSTI